MVTDVFLATYMYVVVASYNPEVVAPRVSLPGCSLTKTLKIKKNLNMLLSAQGKRSNPLLANLLAKPSTAGPASGGKGQPKHKAKAPPASDGPVPDPDGWMAA